ALYQIAFGQDSRLERDIREALQGARCETPSNFAVEIETVESADRPFTIEYKVGQASRPVQTGTARLVVLRGKATQPEYARHKDTPNIARREELADQDHRVLRRNDIVFDDADEANATVSRRHAHIRREAGEYLLTDDGSEYGTRIFRDGRSIEVP